MDPVAHQDVADFARHRLGCQCAPEVFRCIRLEATGAAGLPVVQVVIGDRLLIWLVADAAAAAHVADLAAAGIQERDRHGYNRFRLVLAEAGSDTGARFSTAAGGDAKAHLHVVAMADWPAPVRDRPGLVRG